jgi:hypothetical protein
LATGATATGATTHITCSTAAAAATTNNDGINHGHACW